METITKHRETHNSTKLPGEKIQGISFKTERYVLDTHPKLTGKTKAQSPGGGVHMSSEY